MEAEKSGSKYSRVGKGNMRDLGLMVRSHTVNAFGFVDYTVSITNYSTKAVIDNMQINRHVTIKCYKNGKKECVEIN